MEQVFNPPVDVSWFQRALDEACVDRGCELRIQWAPRLTMARVVGADGTTRDYAKYPVLLSHFTKYQRGQSYVRTVNGRLRTVGYQKTGAIIPPGIRLTDIALPDIAIENISIHQFVIERKVPDNSARKYHNEKQRLALANLGFDLFGDFPKEGVWDLFDYINVHNGTCCALAEEKQVSRCVGLYREPDHDDLERARASLKEWIEKPAYRNPMMAAELVGQVLTKDLIMGEELALLEILKDVRECSKLDEIAQKRERVAMGVNAPRHRTAY